MTEFIGEAELRARGIPAPWKMGRPDKVRFHELDALNHVNNTAYLLWFETFRVSWMAEHELAYYGSDAPVLVLKSTAAEFLSPLHLNDDYVVCARFVSLRRTSFVMDYAVFTDRLCATGTAVHVLFENDGVSRRPIPADIRRLMVKQDGAVEE